ncbi:hypothetical protein [Aurantivibrio infirmus]
MKNILRVFVISLAVLVNPVAFSDDLGSCLVDHLDGKERKNLAKWIFFAIAAHPEINKYSSATSADVTESDRFVGSLVTRLMTEDCPKELQTANRANPRAIEQAFELVGQVAMQELMTNQNVTTTITNYVKYADQDKITKLLTE